MTESVCVCAGIQPWTDGFRANRLIASTNMPHLYGFLATAFDNWTDKSIESPSFVTDKCLWSIDCLKKEAITHCVWCWTLPCRYIFATQKPFNINALCIAYLIRICFHFDDVRSRATGRNSVIHQATITIECGHMNGYRGWQPVICFATAIANEITNNCTWCQKCWPIPTAPSWCSNRDFHVVLNCMSN